MWPMPGKGKRKAASSAADGVAPAASGKQGKEKEGASRAGCEGSEGLPRQDPAAGPVGTKFLHRRYERQQWQDYFDQQPLTAEAASDAATLLPVQMPRKCLPRTAAPAAGSSGADSSTQQEIISYSNAGGRQLLFQPAEAPDGI